MDLQQRRAAVAGTPGRGPPGQRALGEPAVARVGLQSAANRKTLEGKQHPDRDAQFKHINRRVRAFQRQRQPVVSVDTKKKELVGPFKNTGREWRPHGHPEPVRVHDFPDKALGKAIPYGVYDLTCDAGWVSVGVDHDTASFAVETLRRWWRRMGLVSCPAARRLLVTTDGGGSNGSRNRLWKWELQQLADETELRISVCHFPPGTSKWNKIEHRMFCHITENWRGRPLVSREVGGEPDRPHDDAKRLGGPFRVGREQLPHGAAGDGGTDGKSFAQARQVSRRLELQPYAARSQEIDNLFWREA